MPSFKTSKGTLTIETFKCECDEKECYEVIEIHLDNNLLTILEMEDIKELVDFLDEYIERQIEHKLRIMAV